MLPATTTPSASAPAFGLAALASILGLEAALELAAGDQSFLAGAMLAAGQLIARGRRVEVVRA